MAGIRIGVLGCGGRMGRMLVGEIVAAEGCTVAGGAEALGSATIGRDIGELAGLRPLGLSVGSDRAALFAASDVVIDFTVPAASVAHAALAASLGRALVIGTTGLDVAQSQAVKQAARAAPIMWAPNMSLAVTLLIELVEDAARRLGPDYDIEILEMHHRDKIDAPSGTALALGRAAAAGRGIDLDSVAQRVRDGHIGARRRGDIGRRAPRARPPRHHPTGFRPRRGDRGQMGRRQAARPLRHEGRARAPLRAARSVAACPATWIASSCRSSR